MLDKSNINNQEDIFCYDSDKKLEQLELPNLIRIGNYFLRANSKLKYILMPNVLNIGDGFLYISPSNCYIHKKEAISSFPCKSLYKNRAIFLNIAPQNVFVFLSIILISYL